MVEAVNAVLATMGRTPFTIDDTKGEDEEDGLDTDSALCGYE